VDKTNQNTNNRSWKNRINFNTIAALFFVLFSIVGYLLIPYQVGKPKLFMGRLLMPLKPNLFPQVTFLGLLGLSLWYLIHSFHLEEKNLFTGVGRSGYLKILVTFGVSMAYALVFEALGFVISSGLVVIILSFYYGNRNLLILAILISITVAIYFVFTRGLHVSLPESPLLKFGSTDIIVGLYKM